MLCENPSHAFFSIRLDGYLFVEMRHLNQFPRLAVLLAGDRRDSDETG